MSHAAVEILREHLHAAPYRHGLLQGALHGDDRTAGNTITTVQQAMSLFFQDDIRRRVPGRGRPATDLADLPKDGAFNQEISDLAGQTRVSRTNWQTGAMAGRTFSGEDIAIIRPEEIRRLPERHALVIAENGQPIIAQLSRCIDGRREPGCSHASNVSAPSWPSDTPRLRLRKPGLSQHWLRCDVAESPPSRSPTGDRKSRQPAVGAAFPGAGPVGGFGVPGT
jgi:hypothetical protein